MSNRRSFFNEVFGSLSSAVSVAAAIEGRRKPRAHDLRRLGIDPDQFNGIRRG